MRRSLPRPRGPWSSRWLAVSLCAAALAAPAGAQAAQQVVADIPVGSQPSAVAVNETNNRVYSNRFDFGNGSWALSVIDGASDEIVRNLPFGGGYQAQFAVDPSANKLYFTGMTGQLWGYDFSQGSYFSIALPNPAATLKGIAINPSTDRIYATDYDNAALSVIDASNNAVLDTIQLPLGSHPQSVAVNPTTNRVYVSAFNSGNDPGTVHVFDGADNSPVDTVPVGHGAWGLAADPVSGRVYVANLNDASVSVIEGTTVSATVGVGTSPSFVAVDRSRDKAYVTNNSDGTVSVIDGSTASVEQTLSVGSGSVPLGVAVNSDTHKAYVGKAGAGSVAVIADEPPPNSAPECFDRSGSVDSGQTVSLDLRCTDPDGDALSYATVSEPSHGTLEWAEDPGSDPVPFYTPAPGFSGSDTFTYKASDGQAESNVATVTMTVVDANTDADGDGILDPVDSDPSTPSDSFSDGAGSTGSVVDRAGLAVAVEDASSPEGLRVTVGPGTGEATLQVCGGFTLRVAAGSEIVVTCGSVSVRVVEGQGRVILGGGLTTVLVPEGGAAKVDETADGSFRVENLGHRDVTVVVDGVETTIGPSAERTVTAWDFRGFAAPVDNPDVMNILNAGQSVPLKWRLVRANGTPVTTLTAARLTTSKLPCGVGATADQLEEVAPGASDLKNLGNGYYQLNWRTPKDYSLSCRTLHLDLGEGVKRDAWFRFK